MQKKSLSFRSFILALPVCVSFASIDSSYARSSEVYNGPDKQKIEEALRHQRKIQQSLDRLKYGQEAQREQIIDNARQEKATKNKSGKKVSKLPNGDVKVEYGVGPEGYRLHPRTAKRKFNVNKKKKSSWMTTAGVAGGIGLAGGAVLLLGSSGSGSGSSGGTGGGGGVDTETPLSDNLVAIKAQAAYDLGYTGAGVTVAVIDTGVDGEHPELQGKLSDDSFDFLRNRSGSKPVGSGGNKNHGTAVAAIIAGKKDGQVMHGVAYEANILGLRTLESQGQTSTLVSSEARIYAVDHGAKIINNSYGVDVTISQVTDANRVEDLIGTASIAAARYAAENNVINVWSTGNASQSSPSINAGLPRFFPELKDTWIAVGSVDENGGISDFSNRCGVAADWCMVAPGEFINTAGSDSNTSFGYSTFSGTSSSAPHVSAAAAILMQAFPSLTPEEVVDLLLTTATDLGAAGVDTVYGHGLLNLEEATRPQGQVTVATAANVNGSQATLASSTLKTGGALGDALFSTELTTAIIDRYKRTYLVDVADVAKRQQHIENAYEVLSRFSAPKKSREVQLNKNTSLTLTGKKVDQLDLAKKGSVQSASLVSQYDKVAVGAHYNVPMEDVFRFDATKDTADNTTMASGALNNPYLSFSGDGASLTTRYQIGKEKAMKFAAFSGTKQDTDYQYSDRQVHGFVGEYAHKLGESALVSVQLGALQEQSTLLGSVMEGAFALGGNNQTFFGGIAGSYHWSSNLAFYATANAGVTYANAGVSGSLINSVDAIYSDAFSASAVYQDAFYRNDKVGVTLSQPLRVSSGQADMRLSSGRNLDGTLNYSFNQVGLSPTGREIDLEAFYAMPLGQETTLHTGAMLRSQPSHVKDAETDNMMMMRLNHNF